jgi:hypothetical protein
MTALGHGTLLPPLATLILSKDGKRKKKKEKPEKQAHLHEPTPQGLTYLSREPHPRPSCFLQETQQRVIEYEKNSLRPDMSGEGTNPRIVQNNLT